MLPKVYIIILNWNGWKDTIECLESIQKTLYSNYSLIVIDNCSNDTSVEKIESWAAGELPVESPFVSYDASLKPVSILEYDKVTAELGGNNEKEESHACIASCKKMILIQAGANLGFAGGNNIGIRYAMARNDFDYLWILNNDTVIKPDSLNELVLRMQIKPGTGICGSTILYYDKPECVQAYGGFTYNRWFGISKQLGNLERYNSTIDACTIEKKMDGVQGASMFVSKEFITEIGLLSEEYFMYFEEQDWVARSNGRYSIAYTPASIVYHKEGSTIGSSSRFLKKPYQADYYSLRNRIIFTKRYYPYALATVKIGLLLAIVNRIRRRQWDRIPLILKMIFCVITSGKYKR